MRSSVVFQSYSDRNVSVFGRIGDIHNCCCYLCRFSCSYVEHALEVFGMNVTELKASVGRMFAFCFQCLC